MKRLALLAVLIVVAAGSTDGQASEDEDLAIEGTYLWVEDDGDRRAITLDRGGHVTMISDLQGHIGHTVGLGAWRRTGDDQVKARIIDFTFEKGTGERSGTGVATYELQFSDLQDGRYRVVAGSATGRALTFEQDPLDPAESPARTWDFTMRGERITAD